MAWYPSWMLFWVPCCPCCAWPNRTTWSGSSLLVRTSLICIFETFTHSRIFFLLKNAGNTTSSYSTPNTFSCERKSYGSTWLSLFSSSTVSFQRQYLGVPGQLGQGSRSHGQKRYIRQWNLCCFWNPLQQLATKQGGEGEVTVQLRRHHWEKLHQWPVCDKNL